MLDVQIDYKKIKKKSTFFTEV